VRVNSEEQAASGLGTEAQTAAIHAECDSGVWTVEILAALGRTGTRNVGTANHLAGKSPTFPGVATVSRDANATRLKRESEGGYKLGYRVHINPTFGKRQINSITSIEIEK